MLNSGGDPRNVLDARANVSNFVSTMSKGDPLEVCNDLVKKTPAEVQRHLMDGNNLKHVQYTIFTEQRFLQSLAKYVPTEILLKELTPRSGVNNAKLVAFVSNNADMFDFLGDHILNNAASYPDALKKGFEAQRLRKQRTERDALSTSAKMMKKLHSLSNLGGKKISMTNTCADVADIRESIKTGDGFELLQEC